MQNHEFLTGTHHHVFSDDAKEKSVPLTGKVTSLLNKASIPFNVSLFLDLAYLNLEARIFVIRVVYQCLTAVT